MMSFQTEVDPCDCVVVLVEFQYQWTDPGFYHSLVHKSLEDGNVLANAQHLVGQARRLNVPIVHAPIEVDPDRKRGLFAHLTRGLVFRKGSRAAAMDERVYRVGDPVVQGRIAFDAFTASNLLSILENLNRQIVLVGGFITDQCVAKTLSTALNHGFDARLLQDCCATVVPWLQHRTERRFTDRCVNHDVLDM